ncbi:UDP-2,3-diacylglucosamine diphosphatase [Thaumasiovibrio subtropicus]|uniref:UDP-2,3-diacylglucosamine diphosphatase n=1 Tax=Thaumasiovibrio subtropicus TaxID=1891207 RepID=UPI000B361718|nr:UDP-2,3-diacylglucosamine diphosphatase [Thaumasiovibrio subtropicus]
MNTYFIADLHLSDSRPDITACFLHFMRDMTAKKPDALYVLGDLFEMWIGDDETNPFLETIKTAFKAFTDTGIPCYYIHGNRDFMIGKRFAKETGMTLLDEHTVIDLYGTPTLILHGDTLCLGDEQYQKYRKRVHQPWLQWLFMRLPLAYRVKIGNKIRASSGKTKQTKSLNIMDVTLDEVERRFQFHNVAHMIHGHTHRPNIHQHQFGERIVLGDWYEQGSVLKCSDNGEKALMSLAFETQ